MHNDSVVFSLPPALSRASRVGYSHIFPLSLTITSSIPRALVSISTTSIRFFQSTQYIFSSIFPAMSSVLFLNFLLHTFVLNSIQPSHVTHPLLRIFNSAPFIFISSFLLTPNTRIHTPLLVLFNFPFAFNGTFFLSQNTSVASRHLIQSI